MLRGCSLWALLPPVYSVVTAAGLWLVYAVAVYHENVITLGAPYRKRNGTHYPPFISVAGNFPPASCIFSEVMTLAAFGGFVIAVLRYLQLRNRNIKPWLNVTSLVAFSAGCFGMTLVGNFQIFNMKMIHNVGTQMTFGLGTLFCWMQSYITLRVNLNNEGRKVAVARFLLSGAITVCIILKTYFFVMSQRTEGAQCQWSLVMFFLIFLSTFGIDFRHIRLQIVCSDRDADASQGPVTRLQTSDQL
ncbi:transmembrane protein 150C [Mugil cephalus]|uniref:transmembrane protein 150C n=1 Tax=Mugil cephalus TaxID=48193 RepID=UPI001FB68FFD|nr:transmembrane protein 150C [Mugil cephalus]